MYPLSAVPGKPVSSGTERPVVAAFDFDGTLTTGGSVLPFLVAVRGLAPVALAVTRSLPMLARAALVGGTPADEVKEQLFSRLLAGLRADEVAAVAATFAEKHLQERLRPEVHAQVEWHRAQGHRLIIVSASPEYYVATCAALLGMDGAIGTRLSVDASGMLTGRYDGKNCRGAEKYARVMTWLRSAGLTGTARYAQPVLWAYGNSRGDLRLLSAADHGIDVSRLGRWGRLRRFARLGDAATLVAGPPAP
jgi:HAD superfamily hydrolase (TIGR01490 family)